MAAILNRSGMIAEEAEVGFVDQRSGLQGVIGALGLHVVSSEAAQVGVEEMEELLAGFGAIGFGMLGPQAGEEESDCLRVEVGIHQEV